MDTDKCAVIKTGGKQYRVKIGDRICVERLPIDVGSKTSFSDVLLITGSETKVGTPIIANAKVEAKIVRHFRGPKVRIYKKRIKTIYEKRQGHRQNLTEVVIEGIAA